MSIVLNPIHFTKSILFGIDLFLHSQDCYANGRFVRFLDLFNIYYLWFPWIYSNEAWFGSQNYSSLNHGFYHKKSENFINEYAMSGCASFWNDFSLNLNLTFDSLLRDAFPQNTLHATQNHIHGSTDIINLFMALSLTVRSQLKTKAVTSHVLYTIWK